MRNDLSIQSRPASCLLALMLLFVSVLPVNAQDAPKDEQAQAPEPKPRFETTKLGIELNPKVFIFTEPVREDGTIDYIAAMNKKYSQGITQDNNAFRELYLVMPTQHDSIDAAYFKKMDAILEIDRNDRERVPVWIDWFVFGEQLGLTQHEWADILESHIAGPFDDEPGAKLLAWIQANETAFDQIIKSVGLSHYWVPLIDHPKEIAGLLIEKATLHADANRWIARGLRCRANYLASIGQHGRAIDALFAICQLAKLQSKDRTLHALMGAYSIDRIAGECMKDLLQHGDIPAKILAKAAKHWRNYEPAFMVPGRVETDLRCLVQDSVMQIASGRQTAQHAIFGISRDGQKKTYFFDEGIVAGDFDINLALSLIATTFKERAVMLRQPTYTAYQKVNKDWEKVAFSAKVFASGALLEEGDGDLRVKPGLAPEKRAAYLTTLVVGVLDTSHASLNVEYRWHAEYQAIAAAIAVKRYYLKHNKRPAGLDDLVPDYLDVVPVDPMDGKPLRFKPLKEGFAVYSVGTNLIDDGANDDHGDIVTKIQWGND